MNSYKKAEIILTRRRRLGIQLGLDRLSQVLKKLGDPQKKFKAIHVAGTNGKGSVCAMTESILHEAGYRTGLYTSPHFFEYRERIRLDTKIISKEKFAQYFFKVFHLAEKEAIFLTEFELLTAAAILCFAENRVDVAVLEVGLGGCLDATNLCEPIVTAITRIGLDHREFLGNTLEKIAREKAGIIKKNVPVVTLKDNLKEIIKIARQKKTPVFYATGAEKFWPNLSLGGAFQKENLSLVLKILEILKQRGFKISEAAVKTGLKKVFWPGRFQIIHQKPTVIVDGAHNPQAAATLVKALKQKFPGRKIIFVVGILKRKDYQGILKALAPVAEKFFLFDKFDEPSHSIKKMARYLERLKKSWARFSSFSLPGHQDKIYCFAGSLKIIKLAFGILNIKIS